MIKMLVVPLETMLDLVALAKIKGGNKINKLHRGTMLNLEDQEELLSLQEIDHKIETCDKDCNLPEMLEARTSSRLTLPEVKAADSSTKSPKTKDNHSRPKRFPMTVTTTTTSKTTSEKIKTLLKTMRTRKVRQKCMLKKDTRMNSWKTNGELRKGKINGLRRREKNRFWRKKRKRLISWKFREKESFRTKTQE